jgi:hypothetical protein
LIDVGCQTIRHVETDIDRSIDREKKSETTILIIIEIRKL